MIGQGSYNVKPLSPSAPFSDPYGSEVLGTPFPTASCPPTPAAPLPTPGDLRRLAKAPHPTHLLKCPRCDSLETKFCYYNNYSLAQPRYFCKNCKRYWTAGGALRNVPVGGGLRKTKRCKLKLQAEAAQAAAAAAQELAAQEALDPLQNYEVNRPQSPVLASSGTMGSSSTSCVSSIVSGIPANLVLTVPAPAMIRTSSGSDGSSVECAGNDNCGSVGVGAAYVTNQQQNGTQLQHFFGELCAAQAAVPQFYPSYSTSLRPSNLHEYGGAANERGAASYHEVGYVDQLLHSSSSCMDLLKGNKGAGSNPAHANNGEAAYLHVLASSNGSHEREDDVKQEKEEVITAHSQYDWQLISENLFNAPAVEGFLPQLAGGTWSDFSQFQDPSGPAG